MINVRVCLFIFLAFQAGFVYTNAADKLSEAKSNYNILRANFNNWDSALYGIRSYHRRRLYNILIDMIGRDIETDTDYRISIPDILENKYYSSDLYNTRWLNIHGNTDNTNVKEITEKGSAYIKEVERNKYLFSLSGRIRKFRIIETCAGRTVHLYLESVKLRRDF